MTLVVYITQDFKFKYRLYDNYILFEIGDKNNYGWTVISIQYLYKKRFIDKIKYNTIIEKQWENKKKINKIKDYIKDNMYNIILLILLLIILVNSLAN